MSWSLSFYSQIPLHNLNQISSIYSPHPSLLMSLHAASLHSCHPHASLSSYAALGCKGQRSHCSQPQNVLLKLQVSSAVSQKNGNKPHLMSPCLNKDINVPWNAPVIARSLSFRRGIIARANLPLISGIPFVGSVANFILNPALLVIIYLAGAIRFWSGFIRTTYSSTTVAKVGLTALWPVLFLLSKEYRKNFKKAIQ
ncbi:hypothetical protein O6H91_12G090900 [Diphasiastrum complanatum]|uniref:Uncharacterized protein n=2 Tax=Diphasiastrum complanatum TaxID=34168 RepID=A0ACC2C509_DIPCM|nr:hypothetical protein O6H91_12G090900 [Diphasiastrum complanatum]KAJ7536978.1 hypothetical protein O6H91_12G090900 [Diphasiastrum complanatum]